MSFNVGRGEAVGLVGESGSGKSTIGRLLLGLCRPSAGRVLVDGIDSGAGRAGALKRLRRRMQLVFQDPYSSLDPRRRVGDQIADGLAIHRLAPRARAADAGGGAVAGRSGWSRRTPSRIRTSSAAGSGSASASLARCPPGRIFWWRMSRCRLWTCRCRRRCCACWRICARRLGLGLLFISHDLPVVRSLCDRVIVLYLGRVMEEGPAARGAGASAASLYAGAAVGRAKLRSGAAAAADCCCLASRPARPIRRPAACSAPLPVGDRGLRRGGAGLARIGDAPQSLHPG